MKINVELEIDWVENDNIDDLVKQEVIAGVVNRLSKVVEEQTKDQIQKKVEGLVIDRVNQVFDEMVSSKIKITDRYGDVEKEYKNVKEMIKERFDKFLTEMVDDRGKPTTYGQKYTRIDYLTKVYIDKMAKDFTDKTVKEVKEKIETMLNQRLKENIGGEITKLLKIDKMLNQKN